MIQYRAGKWGLRFAFSLKGSVFPKALAWAFPCAIGTAALHFTLKFWDQVALKANPGTVGTNLLGGFSFILGFLVVFRSQQAYSRWCSGCAVLHQVQGEWRNAFSCSMAFASIAPEKKEEVALFKSKLACLVSLLYGAALSDVSERQSDMFEFLNLQAIDRASMEFLEKSTYRCEICLQWIQRLLVEAHVGGVLKIEPPILSRVYNQLGNGIVMLNSATQLNDFPMPFPLAQTVTFMLILHWLLTGLVAAAAVERMSWASFIAFAVTFGFWSVHYIGLELEQPFGDDANDLPMAEMQNDFNRSLCELMNGRACHLPLFDFPCKQGSGSGIRKSKMSLSAHVVKTFSGHTEEIRTVQTPLRRARLRSLSAVKYDRDSENMIDQEETSEAAELVRNHSGFAASWSASRSVRVRSPDASSLVSYNVGTTSEVSSPALQNPSPPQTPAHAEAEPAQAQQAEQAPGAAPTKAERLHMLLAETGVPDGLTRVDSACRVSVQLAGAAGREPTKETAAAPRADGDGGRAEEAQLSGPWDQPNLQFGQYSGEGLGAVEPSISATIPYDPEEIVRTTSALVPSPTFWPPFTRGGPPLRGPPTAAAPQAPPAAAAPESLQAVLRHAPSMGGESVISSV